MKGANSSRLGFRRNAEVGRTLLPDFLKHVVVDVRLLEFGFESFGTLLDSRCLLWFKLGHQGSIAPFADKLTLLALVLSHELH